MLAAFVLLPKGDVYMVLQLLKYACVESNKGITHTNNISAALRLHKSPLTNTDDNVHNLTDTITTHLHMSVRDNVCTSFQTFF